MDRLRERSALGRVVERDRLGPGLGENIGQAIGEGGVGSVVRPQPEDTARLEVGGHRRQAVGLVEAAAALVDQGFG